MASCAQVTSTFGSFIKIYSQNCTKLYLSYFDFSCGASTLDIGLSDELSNAHFRDFRCEDPVEKLYYSMGYEQICIIILFSTEDDLDTSENYYPICVSCMSNKEPISKK